VPTTGAVSGSHVYADNGVYLILVTVCDDDGGCGTAEAPVTVRNVAPAVEVLADQAADEGAVLAISLGFSDPGFDFPTAGTVEDFTATVAWGDGTAGVLAVSETPGGPGVPTTGAVSGSHVYADNGVYLILVTVCDDDGGCGDSVFPAVIANVAPTVDAGPDLAILEAGTATLLATLTDPGFDFPTAGTVEDFTATVTWELRSTQNPGILEFPGAPGVPTFGQFAATEAYGDDGVYVVTVTVCDDDGGCGSDTLLLTVGNVDPGIDDVQVYAEANVTLRVAGEKFHDVCVEVSHNGAVTSAACVVRVPGSPDRQTATIASSRLHLLGTGGITVYYTPDDDPVNGQRNGDNPVWVILTFADGSEVRLHHNFNVQHPGTWVWTLDDLSTVMVGKPLTFEMAGSDVGSDDLRSDIAFGDGAAFTATDFWNGASADPARSPDLGGKYVVTKATHKYAAAGTYAVLFQLTDDDGGTTIRSVSVSVG
jgi:hypothetical protein